jgi:hypothetical protein
VRMNRYVAALLVVLGVVGLVGVVAVGRGFAQNVENAAVAKKCSEATLHGTYLFAYNGFAKKGNEQIPFAVAGYDVFDGNGNVNSVSSFNVNGKITRKEHTSGTYSVKADCTSTASYRDGTHYDQFIAPDGSKFAFVQTKPSNVVTATLEPRVTANRVAP